MPEETSDRYSESDLKKGNTTKENLKNFYSLSLKEKAIFLYENILSWLNE